MKDGKIYIGEEIKKIVKLRFKTDSSFAKAWGKSRQAVYDLFKKETIDVNTLLEISKVPSYDFFELYQKKLSLEKENSQEDNSVEALLQIKLGKEKQYKILQLIFGEHKS